MTFFFFNDTATTEIYTLSLHDALPIYGWHAISLRRSCEGFRGVRPFGPSVGVVSHKQLCVFGVRQLYQAPDALGRSEEHTSELQSRQYLVCRLLLEKKKPEVEIRR